ncbi:SOS response-associated peptidase [candidate division WOR-3 bacterium]|nr:SOS response-associated peptidase [candidate division WOR-3 bacterium]
MCGRFAVKSSLAQLKKDFDAAMAESFDAQSVKTPSYNVAPGQNVLILVFEGNRKIKSAKWGLVPSWSKEPKTSYSMINARAESLAVKPSFSGAFRNKRCIVMADGYYEWKKTGKEKTPFYLFNKNGETMAFAGIFDVWTDGKGVFLQTVSIVTVEAGAGIRFIHERAPAILGRKDLDVWIDNGIFDRGKLDSVLNNEEGKSLVFHEVSKKVNSPSFDSPECIAPLE